MKRFIFKILGFSTISIVIFYWVFSQANGYTDTLYLKFTTPKASSLVLGTSRAAQGLQPTILDSILDAEFLNYSFTMLHSPFGSTYLNSIKNKLDVSTNTGVFIITVDPWSLSSFSQDREDSTSFREVRLALGNTPWVNIKPNPVYLLQNFDQHYYKLLFNQQKKAFVHKDGWLEIDLELDSIKSSNVDVKVEKYKKDLLPKAQFSKLRYNFLIKTIKFLKNHGEVYLVRLPIHPKMMRMDSTLMPRFNSDLSKAIDLSNGYLDLTNQNAKYHYTDGNHLHKSSGKEVSAIVAKWIQNLNQQALMDPNKEK